MKKLILFQIFISVIVFSLFFSLCNKAPSPHLHNALLLMQNRTDYTDPLFDEVLKELNMVSKDDANYDHAQELVSRINTVRRQIGEMREKEEEAKKARDAELEKIQNERKELMDKLLAQRAGKFSQSDAELELSRKISEMEKMEQALIDEQKQQQDKDQWTPTPDSFIVTPTDDEGKTEEFWRRKNETLNKQLSQLENRREYFQKQLDNLNTSELPRHVVLQNREKRLTILAQIEEIDKSIETKKQEVEQLKEDLRKSGGLPGWLR
ncbi:MAG: hypothetical protein A2161_00100 [Candidatus Schekmanbacteria bacterium RBG_13_48_7]|uniref:Uncharacterized protein n=1 Tax=Candidatus Schekmanbacteria bacterium RBG_13_48_7 TaxID=1817878 RepID=A0A1F7S259_9BACT|nr:MAG: hypothetical protein A2161_00100 [Candidatus Schekmanbacteria bacterium RBG_13_48_7]